MNLTKMTPMNLTKDIINDLLPLYATNECSADTRRLVEEYLRQNPREAEELRRIMKLSLPGAVPPARSDEEMRAFRETRRRLHKGKWLMGLAIFFSLAPLSISDIDGKVWWCWRDTPLTALAYALIGAVFWLLYAQNRQQSRGF
jgi:ferric-dicitrate binding protein FerR (iron transport regulator)